MPPNKKWIIPISVTLVLLLCFVLIVPDHTNCQSPLTLSNRQQADSVVADVVSRLGGLPRTGIGLTVAEPANQVDVFPVTDWEIEEVTVGNTVSLLGSITDDDPVYAYAIEFRAFYTDQRELRLHWSSWRYGIVICPVVLPLGNGPPGRLAVAP